MVDENANTEFQVEPTITTNNLAERFGCSSTKSLLLNTKSCIKKTPKAINSIDRLLVESLQQLNKADIEIGNTDSDDLYCRSLKNRLKELP